MKRSICFVFGILHFVRQNPGDFAKIEMQNFGKNISDFQKITKKAYNSVYFRKNDFRRRKRKNLGHEIFWAIFLGHENFQAVFLGREIFWAF